MGGGKGLGSNSCLPCANTVFYSFNHTGKAGFQFSVLGCPVPTETHPLDSCLCTPHTPAAPLGLPSPGAILQDSHSSSGGRRAAEQPESHFLPRNTHLQQRGSRATPQRRSPHLLMASRNTQAQARTEHMCPPHPAALWHEASGLESAEAAETESRLFTGKQFSLVFSHVWLRHAGLHAMPGEGHGGGWETEIFCVLPARLDQFDDGDPSHLIFSFTRNRLSGET